jgi:hypothetical protein
MLVVESDLRPSDQLALRIDPGVFVPAPVVHDGVAFEVFGPVEMLVAAHAQRDDGAIRLSLLEDHGVGGNGMRRG